MEKYTTQSLRDRFTATKKEINALDQDMGNIIDEWKKNRTPGIKRYESYNTQVLENPRYVEDVEKMQELEQEKRCLNLAIRFKEKEIVSIIANIAACFIDSELIGKKAYKPAYTKIEKHIKSVTGLDSYASMNDYYVELSVYEKPAYISSRLTAYINCKKDENGRFQSVDIPDNYKLHSDESLLSIARKVLEKETEFNNKIKALENEMKEFQEDMENKHGVYIKRLLFDKLNYEDR